MISDRLLVYVRASSLAPVILREDSITNEQWYFAMVNIARGWIHVRDDRFSKCRNRKNLRRLESFGKSWIGTRNVHGKNVFDPLRLAKRLTCNGMSLDSWYYENIKRWCYGTRGNNQYIEVYRLKFILKRHVFVLHATSVNTGSVQVTHRAVGARTMHVFGTDLVSDPAIWLVESWD